MAHPIIWSPKTFFYPIGNTPATSLVEYVPPDLDVSLLVLGCGDPRNTLYTVHSDSKLPFHRALDFTFCDAEPAVLARNVIIYTLLYDRCDEQTIKCLWKIYLDVFIDKQAFDVLVGHCSKLIDVSSTLETWNAHPYGKIVKYCTLDTLKTLRRYWGLYIAKGQDAALMKADVLKDLHDIKATWNGDGIVLTSMRAAGIMLMELGNLGSGHFSHYWKHGVTDVDPVRVKEAAFVNTSLLHSSSGSNLNIHYGTHPILCFHLAPALASMQNNPRTPTKTMEGMIEVIKTQFGDWCRSFHARVSAKTAALQLRFFLGNAMTFCKALREVAVTQRPNTSYYTNAWGATTISFTSDYDVNSALCPPLGFDIIETSNLADHLGYLNILLIAAPLLRRVPSSILFTNSLVASKKRGSLDIVSALEQIGVDLPFKGAPGFKWPTGR